MTADANTPKPMQPDAARRAQAYREVGREYATPIPWGALPLPEATRRDIQRATTRDWRGYSPHDYPRNASERYKAQTLPWEAHGCTYQGRNTADGRCPKCKRRAHPQRR